MPVLSVSPDTERQSVDVRLLIVRAFLSRQYQLLERNDARHYHIGGIPSLPLVVLVDFP